MKRIFLSITFFLLAIFFGFVIPKQIFAQTTLFSDTFNGADGTVLSAHDSHWVSTNAVNAPPIGDEYQIYNNTAQTGISQLYDVDQLTGITLPSHFIMEEEFTFSPFISNDPNQAFIDLRINDATDENSTTVRFYPTSTSTKVDAYLPNSVHLSTTDGTFNPNGNNVISVEYDAGSYSVVLNGTNVLNFSDSNIVVDHLIINQHINTGIISKFTVTEMSFPTPTPTPASTPQPGQLYVTNQVDNTVSVIDATTGNTTATIPLSTGSTPQAIVYNGHYLYVAQTDYNTGGGIKVIDPATNIVVATIPLGTRNESHLVLNPTGTRLYASDQGNNVYVIDTTNNTLVRTLTGFSTALGMRTDPSDTHLYVVNNGGSSGFISVLNTSDYSFVTTIAVGNQPDDIAITPDGSKAYVSNYGSNTVSVINTNTSQVVNTISEGQNVTEIRMNPSGTYLYVLNQNWNNGPGNVSVINTATDSVTATIPVGFHPLSISISPNGNTVYVTNSQDNNLSVVNAATNTVTGIINTGTYPFATAIIDTTITPTPTPTPTSVPNQPPVVTFTASSTTLNEGDTFTATGSFTDPDSSSWTATVDYGDGSGVQILPLTGNNFSLSHLYKDNGSYSVTVTVTDNQGATGTKTATVIVNNANPVVGAITASVNPIQVNTGTTATVTFIDAGVLDTHTAIFDWGDGTTSLGNVTETNGSGSVSSDHVYLAAGVYTITVTVTDKDNGNGTSVFQYLSVYNPTPQGLFSGARIFTSPTGAYVANPSLTGQVQFGVTAKYDTNNQPTGNVSMNFRQANFSFASMGITLLVTANGKATLMGTGTINGSGNYNFLVTGIDSTTDTIRFQITDPANNDAVIYDSQLGAPATDDPTAVVTGQVIIH